MAQDRVKYVITASNSGGEMSDNVYLTITDQPPSGLVYSKPDAVYNYNVEITNNTLTSSGGVITSYTITPNLVAGLILDENTGIYIYIYIYISIYKLFYT